MNPIFDRTEYDALPESIKAHYSFLQWLWLSDDEKARLVQTETEPETFTD